VYVEGNNNKNEGFYTYKTPKTKMMVSTRINVKNENAHLYMWKTLKPKKAVYARIKHPNRK
jgi:hypothetical protein